MRYPILFKPGVDPRRLLVALLWLLPASASGEPLPDAARYSEQTVERTSFGDPAVRAWVFHRGASGCELSRDIHAHGTARFHWAIQTRSLRFELAAPAGTLLQTPVRLLREAPPWHPSHPLLEPVAAMATIDGYGVWGDAVRARQMLMDLYNGFDQVLYADGAYTANAMHRVRLAADHFRAAYRRFDACLRSESSTQGFAALDRTRVHFATDRHTLDATAAQQVEQVAALVRADNSVRRVFVDGHTDATGRERHNAALSRRRAETVAFQLKRLGVAADKIVMRYHAHRYPVADNASEAGKRENRRTTIRLERTKPQLAQR